MHKACTDFVEHQDQLLVAGVQDGFLGHRRTGTDRVACVQHLQDDVCCFHNLLELAVKGLAGAVLDGTWSNIQRANASRILGFVSLSLGLRGGLKTRLLWLSRQQGTNAIIPVALPSLSCRS